MGQSIPPIVRLIMLPSLHKLFSQTGVGTRKQLSLCRCPSAGQISVPKPLLHRNLGAYSEAVCAQWLLLCTNAVGQQQTGESASLWLE